MSVASSRMEGLEIFTARNFTIRHAGTAMRGQPYGDSLCGDSRPQLSVERSSTVLSACKSGTLRSWQPRQQRTSLAEPRTLPPPQISRHGRLLGENLPRPLAGFGDASLRLQEQRIIVISFGDRRNPRRLAKHRIRLLGLPGLRVGPGQQSLGAV